MKNNVTEIKLPEITPSPLIDLNSPYETISHVQHVLRYLANRDYAASEVGEHDSYGLSLINETLIHALEHAATADLGAFNIIRNAELQDLLKGAE